MKSKKCESCGATFVAGKTVCDYCGSVFDDEMPKPAPATPPQPQPQPVVIQQPKMAKNQTKPKFNIILFAFLLMCGFWPAMIYLIYILNKQSKIK